MPVPKYDELMKPLLMAVKDGQVYKIKDANAALAQQLNLSAEDLAEMLPSGRQTVYKNRVGWAKTYLKKAGLLDSPARATIVITEAGKKVIAENPDKIDSKYLAHFLAGQCDLNDVVYESDVYGMCLIPAGRDVVNPINLIDSSYFEQMLEALAQSFDMVIVDAPPVGMVIDAAEIAAFCDGSVLVLEYNHTRLREVAECKRQMEKSGTPVLGCIINKVNFNALSAKRYYNKNYYSHYTKGYYKHDDKDNQAKA